MKTSAMLMLSVCGMVFALGCESGGSSNYDPTIDLANFIGAVDNPYFPLVPGTRFVYQTTTDEGIEEVSVSVTHSTKVILGVTCVVVHDVATMNGETLEDTWDWYAQDKDGSVWYFGEDTKKYEDGSIITEGSWEAGVNGAKPGIVIKARPEIGDKYRQEYLAGEAEDMAEVLGVDESVTVPYGSFSHCIQTKDWSALEPDIVENKYFAPGAGQVLAEVVKGGSEREVLVSVTTE
ncbi:MAG: hypothetical protein KJ638_10825 [Chloroflexi bacterium]|nr:hypothetical protein [Chloroflexota bacterium]